MPIASHTITCGDDLRALIRELGADEPDPARVTHKILASLSAEEATVVARVTLQDYVRHVLARPFQDVQVQVLPSRPAGPAVKAPQHYETAGGRTPSSKVAAFRDVIAAKLRKSVFIPTTNEWKPLGDCTADDARAAAGNRRDKAAATLVEAERFDLLAEKVGEAGVDTIGELDESVLEAVLGQ